MNVVRTLIVKVQIRIIVETNHFAETQLEPKGKH